LLKIKRKSLTKQSFSKVTEKEGAPFFFIESK